MGKVTTTLGTIYISPKAVATIVYRAVLESYGVVGLASKNIAEGLAQTITNVPMRGISVQYDQDQLNIDIHIIVEYGTRVTTVAHSVANTIRFHVEKAIGMPVHQVNVHIQGMRVSNPE